MEEVVDYKPSDDFDNLCFGCLKEAAGWGKSKDIKTIATKSSSIPALICGVIKDGLASAHPIECPSPLHNHFMGYDNNSRMIYLRAEIKQDSLDKGQDLSEYILVRYKSFALPGDSIEQFIPKNLGGLDRGDNAFHLHSSVDVTLWRNALSKSYEHVKTNDTNIVRFIYIVCYEMEEIRPYDIVFNFKFYSNNGQQLDQTLEGTFKFV